MRIDAISSVSHTAKLKPIARKEDLASISKKATNLAKKEKSPIRWGGAAGVFIGGLAGIGLAVITGGVAAPFILPTIGLGIGAIAGDIIDHKIRPSTPEEDESSERMGDYYSNYKPYD